MEDKKIEGSLKFSFDGYRRNLMRDIEELKEQVRYVANGDNFDSDELVDKFDDVVQHVNILNCVYSNSLEEFSDLSDECVEFLGDEID